MDVLSLELPANISPASRSASCVKSTLFAPKVIDPASSQLISVPSAVNTVLASPTVSSVVAALALPYNILPLARSASFANVKALSAIVKVRVSPED